MIFIALFVFCGLTFLAFADRGGFVKKDKPQLNIETHGTLKNSIRYNQKSGLKYNGSTVLNMKQVGNSIVTETMVSYKKGNTVYLIPHKQRIAIPQYSQKDGYKLVLRSR